MKVHKELPLGHHPATWNDCCWARPARGGTLGGAQPGSGCRGGIRRAWGQSRAPQHHRLSRKGGAGHEASPGLCGSWQLSAHRLSLDHMYIQKSHLVAANGLGQPSHGFCGNPPQTARPGRGLYLPASLVFAPTSNLSPTKESQICCPNQ